MRLSFIVWRDGNSSTKVVECTLLKFQGGKNYNPKPTVTTISTVPNSSTTSNGTIQTTVKVTPITSSDSTSFISSTSTGVSPVKTTESTNQVNHFSTHK